MTTAKKPTALGDLRVLDLAGPLGWYCGKLLADLGADVLRIEPPEGDPGRRLEPFVGDGPDPNSSLAFWYYNTSKRSRWLDLLSDKGRSEFLDLASQADIVIETAQPGVMASLGLSYDRLAGVNPGLIWCAITPFGQTGPRSSWRATDLTGLALCGLLNLAGNPGSPPSQPGGEAGYLQAGVLSAIGCLTALVERDRSGLGQLVDVSLVESLVVANENNLGFHDLMGIQRRRIGRKTFGGLVAVYPCRDGWMIGWLGRRWDQFIGWLDQYGMLPDAWRSPEWADPDYRASHLHEIDAVMDRLTSALTREEIYLESQNRRIANGPVANIDELFADPQLLGREYWLDVEQLETGGLVPYPGAPYKMSKTPWRISRRAPRIDDRHGEGWQTRPPAAEGSGKALVKKAAGGATGSALPLAGLRVIDFTWQIAGPLSTQTLGDYGADVLKIESIVHPDGLRQMPVPRPPGNASLNQSGIFNAFNSSKRSVSLDLSTPGGVELLKRLIGQADITVDNYGVDPFPRWGLTNEALHELCPDLIVARSSVMGRTGPRQHFVGFGYSISSAAGINSHTGFPGDAPVGVCTAHPDYSCNPHHLLVAILAALHYRNLTGEGQIIDLSQHESTVVWNGPALLDYSVNGRVAQPRANRHSQMAPHGVYRSRGEDRWVAIACEDEDDWRKLAVAIGRPELCDDPQFATLELRKKNETALDLEVEKFTRLHTPDEVMILLQTAGVPAGAAHRAIDLVRDPQLSARGQVRRYEHPELGTTLLNGPGFRLSRTPGGIQRHPVLIGEDTEQVISELLGLEEEEIASAYVDGVLQ